MIHEDCIGLFIRGSRGSSKISRRLIQGWYLTCKANISLEMKRSVNVRILKAFTWSFRRGTRPCQVFHSSWINQVALRIEAEGERQVLGRLCRIQMRLWGELPARSRWGSGQQLFCKLPSHSPLLHSLQLPEPLLQKGNGGASDGRIATLLIHWMKSTVLSTWLWTDREIRIFAFKNEMLQFRDGLIYGWRITCSATKVQEDDCQLYRNGPARGKRRPRGRLQRKVKVA